MVAIPDSSPLFWARNRYRHRKEESQDSPVCHPWVYCQFGLPGDVLNEPLKLSGLQVHLSDEWHVYARRRNTNLLIAVGSHWARVLDTAIAESVGEPIELYSGSDFSQAIAVFNRHSR